MSPTTKKDERSRSLAVAQLLVVLVMVCAAGAGIFLIVSKKELESVSHDAVLVEEKPRFKETNRRAKIQKCFPSDIALSFSDPQKPKFRSAQHLISDGTSTTTKPPPTANDPKTLFHLHIQKVGGTALAYALADSLCGCPNPLEKFVPNVCRAKCTTATLSNGQESINLHSRLTQAWRCGLHPTLHQVRHCDLFQNTTKRRIVPEVGLVTWLRHPVDRLLSEFRHCRSTFQTYPTCWDWDFPGPYSDYNLASFLALNNSYSCHNRQTKMLSGCSPEGTDWTDPKANELCLENAKRNLQSKFVFVGIQEANDFFLQALGTYVIRSPRPLAAPKTELHGYLNQVSDKLTFDSLDDKTLERILDLNKYDMQLYDWVLDTLCAKYHLVVNKS